MTFSGEHLFLSNGRGGARSGGGGKGAGGQGGKGGGGGEEAGFLGKTMSFGEAAVPEVGYSLRGLRRIDQRGSRHSRRAERKRGDGCRLKLWVAGDSATCATGPVLPCWRCRLLTQPFPLQPARLQLQAARHILLAHTRTHTHTHAHTHTQTRPLDPH